MLTSSEPVSPLDRGDCLAAVKYFLNLGLSYTLLPMLSDPWTGSIWLEKLEHDIQVLPNEYGIGIRGASDNCGNIMAFAIKCEDDTNYMIPLRETSAYKFLRGFDTLRFEAGGIAHFAFSIDRHVKVSEHEDRERIFAGPLKHARCIAQSGWLGYGASSDTSGRSFRVQMYGDKLLDVRKCPSLVEALKMSGKFQMTVPNEYIVGDLSGPPLL